MTEQTTETNETGRAIAGVPNPRMVTVAVLVSADASDEERHAAGQAGAACFAAFALAGAPPDNRMMARMGGVPVIISYDDPLEVTTSEALEALAG